MAEQNTTKKIDIEVLPYNSNWPQFFETESTLLKQILGDNFLEIHHIGSTSIPNLCAKPIVDIIAVVNNKKNSIKPLEENGYSYKGEINIPFKYFFTKKEPFKINLHVFEKGHPEIELNIKFRNYLRNHPKAVEEYAKLKQELLLNEKSFEKQNGSVFSGYNLGKDTFIRKIIEKSGYNCHRFLKVSHSKEWECYHRIKKEQIFDTINIIYDSNHPSITGENNFHFVLCNATQVVAISHVEFLNSSDAAIRTIAVDKPFQGFGFGKEILLLTEKWLQEQNKKFVKMHSRPEAENFYRKLGYTDCIFEDDKSIQVAHVDLGKKL